jgi:hypothetical protein
MIDAFEQAIATLQAMRIQIRNDFHMSDKDKEDLQNALNIINAYFNN